eukprot:TRINITY_DN11505_c0_g1_i1.p1 TRINITY_DN11505_c0_g1~~TRINITY_DN11505_c0_g1_i1.p1  ORF type:complete len:401 (+),score=101.82 TRINITY_DN11505_c0_g1_i1:117-1319(+)
MDIYKIFVGQLPKFYNEDNLHELFVSFGNIEEVVIIRDKRTGQSRGCGFCIFKNLQDAEQAIQTLHNHRTLPGMTNPLQIKWASGTKFATPHVSNSQMSTKQYNPDPSSLTHKLFVGMIPKNVGELELDRLFQEIGPIDEICVLRDQDLNSKGCAFVRMKKREDAVELMRRYNNQKLFTNSRHNCVIKFADSQQQKLERKMNAIYEDLGFDSSDSISIASTTDESSTCSVNSSIIVSNTSNKFSDNASESNYTVSETYSESFSENTSSIHFTYPFAGLIKVSKMRAAYPTLRPLLTLHGVKDYVEGPNGANLLVHEVPSSMSDDEMKELFSPFGSVIGSKILVSNVDTNNSHPKTFGLVSYSTTAAAAAAIRWFEAVSNKNLSSAFLERNSPIGKIFRTI